MKKIINYLKRLFSNKTQLEEVYTFNRLYRYNIELNKYILDRLQQRSKESIVSKIEWDDFPDDQYGKVELLRNGKIIDKAELIKGENDLIYWRF